MERTPKATFRINETFKITGRGLVFLGEKFSGDLNSGDWIQFTMGSQTRIRKIKAIQFNTRMEDRNNTFGLLIDCKDQDEIDELRNYLPGNTMGFIYDCKDY